ncbi:MAG: hypothetical protein JSR28_11830 [Proteobacteria bacterium]|nr:hypothetical protein [Pseudomonadota bacterium]
MKKIVMVAAVVAGSLALAACGEKKADEAPAADASAAAEVATDAAPAATDAAAAATDAAPAATEAAK